MSFVKRRIDVTISLGEGRFGDTKGPDVTLSGHRVSVAVVAYNGDAQSQLQLRISGLSQDMMNQLTVIGPIMTERQNNRILVAAGDEGQALSVVYEGTISQAWADYNSAPEVVFNVLALSAALQAVKPVNARSYRGSTDVAVIASDLAGVMGFSFENNGVSVQLSNPYFCGTALEQLRACARAAGISYTIDRGVLAIWPRNDARRGDAVEISPQKNLIGYPTFTGGGIAFTILYTPELSLGGLVQVISTIEAAHGEWIVISIVHTLEAEVPGGAWLSQILCQRQING